MSDADLIKLYSGQILELAANIPLQGRLASCDATARRRSPICGSVVTVDLTLSDGRISNFAQEVKACALGQASAAIFGQRIIGRTATEVVQAREQLSAMLTSNGPAPAAPFDTYKVLSPARDYKNRHASVLLVLDATCDALHQAALKE